MSVRGIRNRVMKHNANTIYRVWQEGGTGRIALPLGGDGERWAVYEIDQDYALHFILSYLSDLLVTDRGLRGADFFRARAPYCVTKLKPRPGKTERWLPLNRLYKPLGIDAPFVNYEDFRDAALRVSCDPVELADLWTYSRPGDTHYLYDDDPQSLQDYFLRLQRLFEATGNTLKPAAKKCAPAKRARRRR